MTVWIQISSEGLSEDAPREWGYGGGGQAEGRERTMCICAWMEMMEMMRVDANVPPTSEAFTRPS